MRAESRRRLTTVVFALLVTAATPAFSFSTGHHFDLTASVLRQQEFESSPVKVAQVANWLTDYYAMSPTSRDALQDELGKLHCDNLYDTSQVAAYWGWLLHNAREATRQAAESDDPLAMLTILGVALHTAQDFYAHSNWVETHPRKPGAPYRSETWLSAGGPTDTPIFTGTYPPYPSPPPDGHPEHGSYDAGLNKDSHVRPLWDEAYVFAFFASQELLAAMRGWAEQARPGFWDSVRTYDPVGKPANKLDRDVEAAYELSMWVKGKGADGQWKGDDSGSARYLSKSATEWTSAKASVYVQQIKKHRVHQPLTAGLYSGEAPPPLPPIEPFREKFNAIVIHTVHVEERRGGGGRIDPGGKADLHATVTVDGQAYRDRVLRGKKSYDDPWFTVHLAEAGRTTVPIAIEVWDEDTAIRGGVDACDIHPAAGKRSLSFVLQVADDQLAGDFEGCHHNRERALRSCGAKPDKNRVEINFYVDAREVDSR